MLVGKLVKVLTALLVLFKQKVDYVQVQTDLVVYVTVLDLKVVSVFVFEPQKFVNMGYSFLPVLPFQAFLDVDQNVPFELLLQPGHLILGKRSIMVHKVKQGFVLPASEQVLTSKFLKVLVN